MYIPSDVMDVFGVCSGRRQGEKAKASEEASGKKAQTEGEESSARARGQGRRRDRCVGIILFRHGCKHVHEPEYIGYEPGQPGVQTVRDLASYVSCFP